MTDRRSFLGLTLAALAAPLVGFSKSDRVDALRQMRHKTTGDVVLMLPPESGETEWYEGISENWEYYPIGRN